MGLMSRNKGKLGERELARELSRILNCHAVRGCQFRGGPDSPDVRLDIPGLHVECKRTEQLRLYKAIEQAAADCPDGAVPLLAHRQNKKPWVAIVLLEDLPKLVAVLGEHERLTSTTDPDTQN